jgi:SAM-dependent methyltransferase
MSRVHEQFEEQRASNQSGLPYFDAFSEHRRRLSELILKTASGRVCVLGAGNAYDLDLDALLARFTEVHLVDIDAEALERARARTPEADRPRLFSHAPVDVSGMFHDIERWARLEVTPQELMAAPGAGAKRVAASLPGPFDVVVSSCLLTQLQLSLLQVLGDQHRLFAALRELLTLTHLRVLSALTATAGRALLVTDLCDATVFPAGRPRDDSDLTPLFHELVAAGSVIYTAHPEVFRITLQDDPVLARTFAPARLSTPWLWQNGPERRFLVYALELARK